MMRSAAALGYLTFALLSGCATTVITPLRSAWYYQPELASDGAVSSPADQIKVALINGSERRVNILRVFLNGNSEDPTQEWVFNKAFSIEPGGIVVLETKDFTRKSKADTGSVVPNREVPFSEVCVIPVSMWIAVDLDTRNWLERAYGRVIGDKRDRIHVDLAGRTPSSLPAKWQEKCSLKTIKSLEETEKID